MLRNRGCRCPLLDCEQVTRDKAVIKPAPGTRQCKCKMKLVTKQLGPGMFQQFQQQVGWPASQFPAAVVASWDHLQQVVCQLELAIDNRGKWLRALP